MGNLIHEKLSKEIIELTRKGRKLSNSNFDIRISDFHSKYLFEWGHHRRAGGFV